ncbi:hypothetical protein MMC18_007425 [Xylographa bjoerkii]|nr:hypothetical protein [Xylographa bjoerkii]MCJ1394546.1 hypothetical protein [Xylographa bjoerkii]
MPCTVHPISPSDLPHCITILSRAFGHSSVLIDAMLPHHDTPAGHAQAVASFRQSMQTDPTAHFLKATDDSTGQIFGWAEWLLLEKGLHVEEEAEDGHWDTAEEREWAKVLWGQLLAVRTKAVEEAGGNLLLLSLLCVDPTYQRAGAGTALMQWGTRIADERGVEAILESTPVAAYLYEQNGFRIVEKMKWDVPEKFSGRVKPEVFFMRRPARKSAK